MRTSETEILQMSSTLGQVNQILYRVGQLEHTIGKKGKHFELLFYFGINKRFKKNLEAFYLIVTFPFRSGGASLGKSLVQ